MRRTVVFDLDGTLHHTEMALAPAIARAAADVTGEKEPTYDEINALYGEPLEKFCLALTGSQEEETFEFFMDRVKHHQALTIPELGALYPGVTRVLTQLRELGFDISILSNAHLDYIEMVTEQLGIREFFLHLCGRAQEPSKSARLASLIEGYDMAVMVGDRYHDIQAALENSIPAIACTYGYGNEKEHQGAIKVARPLEILEIIKELIS